MSNTIPKHTIPKPDCPLFSAGPCRKYPTFDPSMIGNNPYLGRSQRSPYIRSEIKTILQRTQKILQIPESYKLAFISGSDTGAFETALWNLLGPKPITVFNWGPFGNKWTQDITIDLELNDQTTINYLPLGDTPISSQFEYNQSSDLVLVLNTTAGGFQFPDTYIKSPQNDCLVLADATSIVFGAPIPWSKLDVITFSFQKVLGGEAGIGVLVMSPNAIQRLCTFRRNCIPNLYRLHKRDGSLNENIFIDNPFNTLSLMSLYDYKCALDWVESTGLKTIFEKTKQNMKTVQMFVKEQHMKDNWIQNMIQNDDYLSPTVACLRIPSMTKDDVLMMRQYLEENEIAYDIGSYPTAPYGLRIWTGPTIDATDLKRLLQWIEYYFWYHHNPAHPL